MISKWHEDLHLYENTLTETICRIKWIDDIRCRFRVACCRPSCKSMRHWRNEQKESCQRWRKCSPPSTFPVTNADSIFFEKILCLTEYRFAFLISIKATRSSPLRISVRSFDTNRVTRHVLLPSRFLSHTHCPFRSTSALMISSTRFFRRAFTSGTVDEETYE